VESTQVNRSTFCSTSTRINVPSTTNDDNDSTQTPADDDSHSMDSDVVSSLGSDIVSTLGRSVVSSLGSDAISSQLEYSQPTTSATIVYTDSPKGTTAASIANSTIAAVSAGSLAAVIGLVVIYVWMQKRRREHRKVPPGERGFPLDIINRVPMAASQANLLAGSQDTGLDVDSVEYLSGKSVKVSLPSRSPSQMRLGTLSRSNQDLRGTFVQSDPSDTPEIPPRSRLVVNENPSPTREVADSTTMYYA